MLNCYLLTQTVLPSNYEEFFKWKDLFDYSNYSKDSRFFDRTNKIVIVKMKDELGGMIVNEFTGLQSKMYSIKKIDGKENNTAKGVSIATEFDKFKDVLFHKKIIRQKMKRIQHKKSINQEQLKLTKYLYQVLTIKNMCQMMGFIVISTKIVSHKN